MRIVATAVFERLVHMAHCVDRKDPCSPRLEIDALCREGDLDGPVLLTVSMFRVFCPAGSADHAVAHLRRSGRIVEVDGVAHVAFPTWTLHPEAMIETPLEPPSEVPPEAPPDS